MSKDENRFDWPAIGWFVGAVVLQAALVFWIVPPLAKLPDNACSVSRVTPTQVFCGKERTLVGRSTGSDDDKALMAQFKKHAIVEPKRVEDAVKSKPGAPAFKIDTTLSELKVLKTDGGWFLPALGGLLSLAIFAFLSVGARWDALKWLVLGEDGRLSNSKVQLCVASGLTIASVYAYIFARMMSGMPFDAAAAITVPESLTAIISASVVAAGAAKIVAGSKPLPVEKEGSKSPVKWSITDLFSKDDGKTFDVADAQMFILTSTTMILFARQVLLALGEGITLEAELKLPEPALSLALVFGGSLAAYIAPKLSALIPKVDTKTTPDPKTKGS